jgi:type II secretory pathway pseudopilin PulG
MRARVSESGFTLLETLLALIIFVACYLLVHHSVALGWRGVQAAQSETGAAHLGQALLAEASIDGALTDGTRSGTTEDGYRWSFSAIAYDAGDESSAAARIAAYRITVEVGWKDSATRRWRQFRLDTVKLGGRS